MDIWGIELLTEPEDIINEFKRQTDCDLFETIKSTDTDMNTQCPFHKGGHESKPSFGISKVTKRRGKRIIKAGTCHCFTCGYTSDFPNLISDLFGKKDGGKFGYKWLVKNFMTLQIEQKKPIRINLEQHKEKKEVKYVTEEELESYRFTHPYMYKRGLTDDIIDYFDIGFDKNTNCITFPVWDKEAKGVLFVQRRSVGTKFFHFEKDLPKGETLYGIKAVLNHIDKIDKLIICESPIDALTAWKHKMPSIALMGCLITQTQAEILNQLPIHHYLLGLDNDKAGRDGIKRIKRILKGKILDDLDIPSYAKDLNDIKEEDWNGLNKPKLLKL